jgi:hypothetical protein
VEIRSAITGHSAKMDESAAYGKRQAGAVLLFAG